MSEDEPLEDEKAAPVTVVGDGALGLLFAHYAAAHRAPTWVLARTEERAAILEKSGIGVSGPGERPMRRTRGVHATADPSKLPTCGLLLVCVKAHSDAEVARQLASLPRCVTVVTLGNGLGRAEALASLGEDRVLYGSTTEGATPDSYPYVSHEGSGTTRIAPLTEAGRRRAEKTVRRLRSFGFDASLVASAAQLAWEKVQINAAINALTGLLQVPNGRLLELASAREIATRAAIEAGRVARARGVPGDWTEERARERWETVARATSSNWSSTAEDLRRARKSEVHAINGAIFRAGREAGIETPTNELLELLVRAREDENAATPKT